MIDYDDYGASIVLTVKCGAVSYTIPFVKEIIQFDETKDVFVTNEQTFNDMKV